MFDPSNYAAAYLHLHRIDVPGPSAQPESSPTVDAPFQMSPLLQAYPAYHLAAAMASSQLAEFQRSLAHSTNRSSPVSQEEDLPSSTTQETPSQQRKASVENPSPSGSGGLKSKHHSPYSIDALLRQTSESDDEEEETPRKKSKVEGNGHQMMCTDIETDDSKEEVLKAEQADVD